MEDLKEKKTPKGKYTDIQLRMPTELLEAIKRRAAKEEVTVTAYIVNEMWATPAGGA